MTAADDDDFVLLRKTHDAESTRFLGRARTLNAHGENRQGTIDAGLELRVRILKSIPGALA
jgi:hypothetical protein